MNERNVGPSGVAGVGYPEMKAAGARKQLIAANWSKIDNRPDGRNSAAHYRSSR